MDNFKDYAYYYNLIYNDKNYKEEAEQIASLLRKYGCTRENATVLNLGCGTGRHDAELDKLGYQMTGIDMSEDMIQIAKGSSKLFAMNAEFEVADIREYDPCKRYDAVISLFHVMSYQNENADVMKAFTTAAKALDKGGIFIFDAWYGPGVLSDKPSVRVKQVEDKENIVYRYAHPIMYAEENIVDVCYDVLVINKKDATAKQIKEVHKMRYFFVPEVTMLLEMAGFSFKVCLDCNTMNKTDYNSWTAFFIAEKR